MPIEQARDVIREQYYLACLAHASYLIADTGYRSAIAASLLLREGFGHVADLVGGIAARASSRPATAPAHAR